MKTLIGTTANKDRGGMEQKGLLKQIAMIESFNDQLQSELCHIDKLLRLLGFDEGIITLKIAAGELLNHQGYSPDN